MLERQRREKQGLARIKSKKAAHKPLFDKSKLYVHAQNETLFADPHSLNPIVDPHSLNHIVDPHSVSPIVNPGKMP